MAYAPDYFTYPPAGRCIYCGDTEGPLSKEHIIPYALNGNWVLPKASCKTCAKFTQKIEEVCTHERWRMFSGFRRQNRMQSCRKHKFEIPADIVHQDGTREQRSFAADRIPTVVYGLRLPPAGILLGKEPTNTAVVDFEYRVSQISGKLPITKGQQLHIGQFRPTAFIQLLAKIGYAFASAELPNEQLHSGLADIILNRSDKGPHFIGGGDDSGDDDDVEAPYSHRIGVRRMHVNNKAFIVVMMRLFGQLALPSYHVVVQERYWRTRSDYSMIASTHSA